MNMKDAAITYAAERGWVCIPLMPKQKKPAMAWSQIQSIEDGIKAIEERPGCNLCLYLGEMSGDVVDIDVDSVKALPLARRWFPPTLSFGRKSKPQSHYLLKCKGVFTKFFKGFDGPSSTVEGNIIEIRSNSKGRKVKGSYTVIPPSIHDKTGEKIEWVDDTASIVSMEEIDIKRIVCRIQLATQLADIWHDGRHNMALLIAGTLAKARIFKEEAIHIVEGICELTGDEEVDDRIKAVETTYEALEAGSPIASLRSFEAENPNWRGIDKWVFRVCKAVPRGSGKDLVIYFPDDAEHAVKMMSQTAAVNSLNWFELEGTGPVKIEEGKILLLNEATVATDITRFNDWRTYNAKGDFVARLPSNQLIKYYLKCPAGTRGLPPLRGMVNNPIFDSDWNIVVEPGHHLETRVYVYTEEAFPRIDTSDEGIDKAIASFYSLFGEFPFTDVPLGVSVFLFKTILVSLKPMLGPTPMLFLDAPTQAAGKTYAAEVIGELGSGYPVRITSMTSQLEELDKKIGSLMRFASPTAVIDNTLRKVQSDILAQALSQESVSFRPLGQSVSIDVKANTSFFGTGVNAKIDMDLARRTLWVRLDPEVERGSTLKYKGDPLSEVRARRPELISQAFSIVSAYTQYGELEKPPNPVASYGGKIQTIREALIWAGLPDPFQALGVGSEGDTERSDISELFHALWKVFGEETFTAASVEEIMLSGATDPSSADSELRHVMRRLGAEGWNRARGIGRVLSNHLDSVMDGLKMVQSRTTKTRGYRIMTL